MEQEIKRALVADDEAAFRLKMERRVLSQILGYHVTIALNDFEIRLNVKNTKYELIYLDLDILGGKQFLLDLRANYDWSTLYNVPVITTTNNPFCVDEFASLIEDTGSVLHTKPLCEDEFLIGIEKACNKSKNIKPLRKFV